MKDYIVVVIEVTKGHKFAHTVQLEAKDKKELLSKLYDMFKETLESINIIREEE